MHTVERIDPDFAREVLRDIYTYREKSLGLTRLLWFAVGFLGGHRFYLGRPGTALLMFFSGGGGLVWWVADWFLLRRMVEEHNSTQERRRAAGLPPLELSFMPSFDEHVLTRPPAWTLEWRLRSRGRRWLRFAGDLVVLLVAGWALGALSGQEGAEEAIVAVLAVIGVTAAGGYVGSLEAYPGIRGLVRWSHRLRLFYYFNEPRSPLFLLLRPVTGIMLAPFRQRDRAEVRLYLQIGFIFTFAFLLLDLFPLLIVPVVRDGLAAAAPGALFNVWVREATVTFLMTYAFAAPIGAVLTLYLLTRHTHTVPRALSALTVVAIAWGVVGRG
jgi:hypothetical protein